MAVRKATVGAYLTVDQVKGLFIAKPIIEKVEAKLKEFAETKHKKLPEEVEEGVIKDIYFRLSPDAQYDSSKEKSRRPGNLADYREFVKKNKSK
mgnify:CR=1 FL=1